MAIVTPGWDEDSGPTRVKKEQDSEDQHKGVTVTALSLPPLPAGAPSGSLTGIEKKGHPHFAPTGHAAPKTLGAGYPTPDPLSEGAGCPPLPDSWDSGETILPNILVKTGSGPGRPVATVWNSDGYPPVEIDRLLVDYYGTDWLLWEPETLREQILMDFRTTLSDTVFDKIMAIKLCHSSQSPWKEWDVFENVCLAFNDIPVDFQAMQYLSVGQLAYGVMQMNLISKETLGDDVNAYIAVRAHTEGFVYLPEPLTSAQPSLDRLNTTSVDFRKEIQDVWTTLQTQNLKTWEFPDTTLGVQLSYLAEVKLYMDNRSALAGTRPEQGHE